MLYTMLTALVALNDQGSCLPTTIRSIGGQEALHRIARVLVFGPAAKERLGQVYSELGDVTRTLEFVPVNTTSGVELTRILDLVQTEYVALLGDQDEWSPEHLQGSLDLLSSNPAYVAVYSNFNQSCGKQFPLSSSRTAWRVWLASECDFSKATVELDETATFLISLLDSNLHLSTLVARTEELQTACKSLPPASEDYDDSRIIPLYLAKQGPLSYKINPSVTVHVEDEKDIAPGQHSTAYWEASVRTTKWLMKKEPEKVALAAGRFNRHAEEVPRIASPHAAYPAMDTVLYGIAGPQWSTLMFEAGLDLIAREPPVRGWKWLARQLCPPTLLALRQRGG